MADEYAFELIELTAMTCAAIRSRLKRELGFLTGRLAAVITAIPIELRQGQSSIFGTQLLHAALFNIGDAT